MHFWNIAAERCLKCEQLRKKPRHGGDGDEGKAGKISELSLVGNELLASSSATVDAWRVLRDVKCSPPAAPSRRLRSLCASKPPFA